MVIIFGVIYSHKHVISYVCIPLKDGTVRLLSFSTVRGSFTKWIQSFSTKLKVRYRTPGVPGFSMWTCPGHWMGQNNICSMYVTEGNHYFLLSVETLRYLFLTINDLLQYLLFLSESRRIEESGGYMFTQTAVPSNFNFGESNWWLMLQCCCLAYYAFKKTVLCTNSVLLVITAVNVISPIILAFQNITFNNLVLKRWTHKIDSTLMTCNI